MTASLTGVNSTPNAIPFQVGQKLGDYQLLSILGQGSFGTVYLARELHLQREVALKVCPEDFYEGRTIAQLEHESIVRVHSQKVIQGFYAIDMQYVPSMTLGTLVSFLKEECQKGWNGSSWVEFLESAFPNSSLTIGQYRSREFLLQSSAIDLVAWLGWQIAEAIAYAHQKGILHLDIKPENILIHPSGKPYVMDFNVSTQKSELLEGVPRNYGGTFHYMSPEQLAVFSSASKEEAVREVNESSDIYSLGQVLLELLNLIPEKTEESSNLKNILIAATQRDKTLRFYHMHEFSSALEGHLKWTERKSGLPGLGPLLQWTKRHPILGLTLWGAIPQALAAIVGYLYNYSQVIRRLGELQTQTFNQTNLYYSVLTSCISLIVWSWVLSQIYSALKQAQNQQPRTTLQKERKFLISIPLWGSLVGAMSWLPAMIVFPVSLSVQGELSLTTLLHLELSFFLSFIIAFSYSFIVHSYLVTSTLYSDFLKGEIDPIVPAKQELSPLFQRLKWVSLFTVTIPLSSIWSVLYLNDTFLDSERYNSFRLLLVLLVSPGTLGMWFAFYAKDQVRTIVKLLSFDSN